MTPFSPDNEDRTLVRDYDDLTTGQIAQTRLNLSAQDLTHQAYKLEINQNLVLPHIFEVCFMINHPVFLGITTQFRKNISLWSGTPVEIWIPSAQVPKGALYITTIKKIHKTHYGFDIEKASNQAPPAMAMFMPINLFINRGYKTNDDEVREVAESGQYPRDFFIHSNHWNEFNKYSRLLQVDKLLRSGK